MAWNTLVQGFCQLTIKITQFPDGFRLKGFGEEKITFKLLYLQNLETTKSVFWRQLIPSNTEMWKSRLSDKSSNAQIAQHYYNITNTAKSLAVRLYRP